MRRLALGKVGHVGDSSNDFNIGGVGDRYRACCSDRPGTASDRHALHCPGSKRPAPCRGPGDARARAGRRATDRAQASRCQ
jgi:hypothetical protein